MLFDAHNHLQSEAPERLPEVLGRAAKAGVTRMMTCGTGAPKDWDALQRLDDLYRGVVSISAGLHPWQVATSPIGWKAELERILDTRPFCVGEIGLDKSPKSDATIDDQLKAFNWQLDLALERALPVTIHCVGAWDHVQRAIATRHKLRIAIHSHRTSPEMTTALARYDVYFSIGPMCLGGQGKPIAPTLACIPPDHLLIETDSPNANLPPDRKPEAGNEPAEVKDVCMRVARLLGKDPAEIEQHTFANAEKCFSIHPAPVRATSPQPLSQS